MRIGIAVAAIAASLVLVGGLFVLAGPALASPYMGEGPDRMGNGTTTSGFMEDDMSMMWGNDSGKMFGAMSSIQNDEEDEPAWIVMGHWMMSNDTGGSNTTGTNVTDFYAGFQMIGLDGSAAHSHEISNFTQDGESTTEGNSTTIVGTSTVTMREGPVDDVDTEITISEGKVIEISLDQEALDNHFGDTPIYGIVITPEIMQHIMNMTMTSSMGDMMGGWHGNETGTAMGGWEGNETGTMAGEWR